MTTNTLYLLVTCSMDETRCELAGEVAKNLIAENKNQSFFSDLLVFDNASRFEGHLKFFPTEVRVVRSDRNVGYWSAINWVLDHYQELFGRSYTYIYIIESDLVHRNMSRLDACEQFLEEHQEVGGVRTQEFSVRWRMLYDKKYHWAPFARRHSLVSQNNAITGERVWFRLGDGRRRIWLTNFHAKLPALNRLGAMRKVFTELSERDEITELDFMHLYYGLYSNMALLDGGIYRMLSSSDTSHISGSYSTAQQLAKAGYHNTRIGYILKTGFSISRFEPSST
jgi:hypothetical protein